MKKYLITLLPVLILSIQPDSPSAGAHKGVTYSLPAPADDDLKPTVSQEKVEQLVAKLLTTYHYRKVRLNDSLSSKVWDNYLEQVDRGKTYLLASDVAAFDKYRTQVDDALVNGDLSAGYELYNVFRKRYKERSAYVQEILKKPFTFTEDETYNTSREKAPWAKETSELNEIWRKTLKNQALELKLAGQKDSAITATLTQRYKNLDKAVGRVRSDDVFQIYMNAFAETLDPHTVYFNPSSADRFNQDMSQSLEGIGAMLQEDGEFIKISSVLPGGPAFKSKQLTANDKIVGVAQGDNGPMVSIVGYRVDDAVKLIKGPKASVVRLQVQSADALASAPPKEVRMVREKIKLEGTRAKKEVLEITDNGKSYSIGVINIPAFYRDFEGARKREENFSSTTNDVKKLVDSLKAQKVDGIVIDLRNNPGGALTEAIDLTGLFIPKGPVVQVREGSGETEVYSDQNPGVAYDGPLAVLVNWGSASASEIFAAAIQDYKRGIIVGGQTFGKGTVQTLIDLNQWLPKEPDKAGQVKMTIQKYYRINGNSVQRKGVTPDIELPSGYSSAEYGENSQPSAMPWDQIASTQFDVSNSLDDKLLSRLRSRFDDRLKSDVELKKLAQELADFKKAKENTVVSLQETKRRKERDEAEKKRAALKKEAAEDPEDIDETGTPTTAKVDKDKPKKKPKDLYLTETGRILADYIVARNK